MSFTRKRSFDKRIATNQSINSTEQTNKSSFSDHITNIKTIINKFAEIPLENLYRCITQILNSILSTKKNILIIPRFVGYKQCFNLMIQYCQQLKFKGIDLANQESALPFSIFCSIVDQINKISQDQKNDSTMEQVNLTKQIFGLLEALVSTIEAESQKKQRKVTLMRKNSLKKVQQLPTMRPSSRGKLSSLSKRQKFPSKGQLLNIPEKNQNPTSSSELNSLEESVYKMLSILKNLSANKRTRRTILTQDYVRLLNRYLSIWNDKNISNYGTSAMVQITSAYRHLAADQKSYKLFLQCSCIQVWARIIEMFPTSNDLIFNILRILSKISSYPECCDKLNEKKGCLKALGTFFKVYRIAFIFAYFIYYFRNMTSFLTDIRSQLYFDFAVWPDIFGCFIHYAQSQLKGKSQVEKMGISMAAWDYQAMKKQSDIDAIIKIIRLIANIFTVNDIGQDIYLKDTKSYRQLVFKLKSLLQKKSISNHADLISCILSCLTNVLYYDKEVLLSSLEYKATKTQLIQLLVNFVVQIDNEEICCQSLRVISNLTRMKDTIKIIIESKIDQAVLILLDSTSKQIVYYSLGIILNLISDQDFRKQHIKEIVNGVIDIIKACSSDDFDLTGVCLKVLNAITNQVQIDPQQLSAIEQCLINFGSQCDKIIMNGDKKTQLNSVQQSRALINVLLNNLPQQKFICPIKNCGRKFADDHKLNEHINRRHKAS